MRTDTLSYWIDTTVETNYPELTEDLEVDIGIVGGGIVGITAAHLFKNEGYKVAVIEADRICKATTGHTTAKITSQHTLIYDKAIRTFGKDKAKEYADANEYAIRFVEGLIKKNGIECDYEKKSAYVFTQDEKHVNDIEKEAKAALSLGLPAEYTKETSLPFSVLCALRFNNQAQFHPRKYILALAKGIPEDGSYIFENTKAVNIEKGKICNIITSNDKRVKARNTIIASHYPFYDGKGLYFTRMYASRTYLLAFKIKETIPKGMFINVDNPGITLRSQNHRGEEILIFGGGGHKTAHGEDTSVHYDSLRKMIRESFTIEEELYHWSAQDYYTLDGIPYIGRLIADLPNVYLATGFGKWGITNGTVAAILIKDLVTTGKSPWEKVYSPQRKITGTGAIGFATQNLDVAYQLVSGKLKGPEDGMEIKRGEGKIIEYKGNRAGAYRDEEGKLYLVDITCTHMGCELKWNSAEKTWDCPCHGSRFKYNGDIVEGPALHPLKHPDEGRNIVEPNVFKP